MIVRAAVTLGLLLVLCTAVADAQIAGSGSGGPSFKRPRDDFGMGLAGVTGAGSPVVNPCTGAADMSDGCAVAVFGR